MATEAVRDRVRKLLELSRSPEEHEAASALRRAEELMAKHGLTRVDVESAEAWTEDDVLVDPMLMPYRQMLVRAVALSRGVVALQKKVEVGFRGGAAAVRDALETYQAIRCAAERAHSPFAMIVGADGDDFFFMVFWQTLAEVAPRRLGLPTGSKPREEPPPPPGSGGVSADEKNTVDAALAKGGESAVRIMFREAREAAERVLTEAGVGPWRPDLRALAG